MPDIVTELFLLLSAVPCVKQWDTESLFCENNLLTYVYVEILLYEREHLIASLCLFIWPCIQRRQRRDSALIHLSIQPFIGETLSNVCRRLTGVALFILETLT